MARKKVKLAFIENNAERKASYKKRQKGFLKKAHELSTLCDIEVAVVVYSPYHEEPVVFPNHASTISTFTKARELPEQVQSRNMVTQERFSRIRIKKLEEQLRRIKKENRVMELTNQMHALLLNGEDIPANMELYNLNDLSYVINQNLKQVDETIKVKTHVEGSTSNVPRPVARPMVIGGTSSERLQAPPLPYNGASVSRVPFLAPLNAPGVSNFERPRAPSLVSGVASISTVLLVDPLMIPAAAPAQVPQPTFHLVDHLRTPPLPAPLVGPSQVSSFSSQIFPPIISQSCPLIPHQMALRRAPEVALPMPLTTVASPMPSSMMPPLISAPVSSPMKSQIEPLMNVPSTSASEPTSIYQNYSLGFPQSLTFSEMLDRSDDDDDDYIKALLDDPSFNYTNFHDSNHQNNNF